MPIYEYRCDACHEQLETMHGISAEPLRTCPSCGEDAMRRLISSTSFVLKGSGWYQSDYGRASSPSGDGDTASGDGGATTESPSTGGSESSDD